LNETSATGLTLLVSRLGRARSWTFRPEFLRPLVSRVLLVTDDRGHHLLSMLGKAFPGKAIEPLTLNNDTSARERTDRLRGLLGADDRWILLLEAGCNVLVQPDFQFPNKPEPQNLLHQSRDGASGFWSTALIPGDPAYLSIQAGGEVTVEASDDAPYNNSLIIDAPHAFETNRKTLVERLNAALPAHRENKDPDRALEIAGYYFDLEQYRAAGVWYRNCLLNSEHAEQQWRARYQLGRCQQLLNAPWLQVETALAEAFDIDPNRSEPLYHLSRHYFESGNPQRALDLAEIALPLDLPHSRYPFELSIYTHELPHLYMKCAEQLGRNRECIRVANRTLRRPTVPETVRIEVAAIRSKCLKRLQPTHVTASPPSNRIVVICPFRNAGEHVKQCADSLAAQDYEHCQFVLIDDASTDGALDQADTRDPRFTVVRNETRVGGLANQVDVLEQYCEPDDIAVYLDGDDRLLGTDALRYVNDFFNATGCWVMYGQYQESNKRYGRCEPIVEDYENVFDTIRHMHFPMHIRAHRAGLFHRLKEADPELRRLRDEDGQFLELINDMTMMHAIMQIAGLAHIRYNDRIIYEYNVDNPQSHFRERMEQRRRQIRVLEAKAPLAPLVSYKEKP